MSQKTVVSETALTPAGRRSGMAGVLLALGGFGLWGFMPILFKAMQEAPAMEILAHRVLWSAVFVGGGLALTGHWPEVRAVFRTPKLLLRMLMSAGFISVNWGLFIWAVNNEHILQGSLGYYINPMINVVLGVLVLKEKLTWLQWVAVGLAMAAVLNFVVGLGEVPWISLILGLSFSCYGLTRKMAPVDAAPGLFVETVILLIPALGYLIYVTVMGTGSLGRVSWEFDLLLISAGAATSIPLLMFTAAAKRLRYATLGIVQYLTPTLQFLLAVLLYDEIFTSAHLLTFALIWLGVAVYSIDTWRNRRR